MPLRLWRARVNCPWYTWMNSKSLEVSALLIIHSGAESEGSIIKGDFSINCRVSVFKHNLFSPNLNNTKTASQWSHHPETRWLMLVVFSWEINMENCTWPQKKNKKSNPTAIKKKKFVPCIKTSWIDLEFWGHINEGCSIKVWWIKCELHVQSLDSFYSELVVWHHRGERDKLSVNCWAGPQATRNWCLLTPLSVNHIFHRCVTQVSGSARGCGGTLTAVTSVVNVVLLVFIQTVLSLCHWVTLCFFFCSLLGNEDYWLTIVSLLIFFLSIADQTDNSDYRLWSSHSL